MLAGNYEKAIQAFKQSFEYKHPEAFVYDSIAQCYFEFQGNHEESRTTLRRAVKTIHHFTVHGMALEWPCRKNVGTELFII